MPKTNIPFIQVIESRRNKVGGYSTEAYFYLEIDNWNDFGYYTSYHLHCSEFVTEDKEPILIGHVRILKFGQDKGSINMLKSGKVNEFSDQYCSMGSSLDYYERIAQLPDSFRERILHALRDCIVYPDYKDDFEGEPGFRDSLMRDTTSSDEIFTLAPLLISRNFHKLLDMDLSFEFSIPGINTPIEFNFDSPTYGFNNHHLPNRIAVLIGRNGSGKSTLLSRISRIAFSSTNDRRDSSLKKVGIITPPGLGFPRIILLSYSAFDAFNTPGIYKSDKETILSEMKNGLGRYVFCGIRDIVSELEDSVKLLETNEEGKLLRKDILQDQIENTKLKSIATLAAEFVRNISIIKETGEEVTFQKALNLLGKEKSMHNLFPVDWDEKTQSYLEKLFMGFSTGHKFVIHAISSITAYTAPRSLLLFDEPETHLHPPILAALMKAIRFVLKKRNAFMIVATHSPVVLQETLKQHVFVIRREGELIDVSRPEIETFGENTGILNQVAFGLTFEITDYHSTLDKLVEEYFDDDLIGSSAPEEALKQIEKLFSSGLSMQSRSYILSRLYRNR